MNNYSILLKDGRKEGEIANFQILDIKISERGGRERGREGK
jgi:hypothetical protein